MATTTILRSGPYALEFETLYARLWDLGDDLGDGSRLYTSQDRTALKWIIKELSGTPAEPGKTLPHNNELRKQVHARLFGDGWADRVNERKFRLLVPPGAAELPRPAGDVPPAWAGEPVPLDDPEDQGVPVDDIPADAWADEAGAITVGGVVWSAWCPLSHAAQVSTKSPGVYLARVGGDIVYVGMAGERRGQGVRGRLTVYARGRGAVSGLGEAVLDRALADPDWVGQRLDQLRSDGPTRAKGWAAAAFDRWPLDVAWTATDSGKAAEDLERQVLIELADTALWNRARPRS
jgi:hypothetical protein